MLRLNAVKTSRVPNRVYLSFANRLVLPFFIDDYVSAKLKSGQEYSDEALLGIISTSVAYLLRDYSLRQIAISPKTERILSIKLKTYIQKSIQKYRLQNYNIDEKKLIEDCISRLKSKNLLNDFDYAKYFINKNRKKSKKEIIFHLQNNGVNIENIPQNFWPEENEIDKIRRILDKKNISSQSMKDFKSRNKIMASLIRKGFSYSDVKRVIDGFTNNE